MIRYDVRGLNNMVGEKRIVKIGWGWLEIYYFGSILWWVWMYIGEVFFVKTNVLWIFLSTFLLILCLIMFSEVRTERMINK